MFGWHAASVEVGAELLTTPEGNVALVNESLEELKEAGRTKHSRSGFSVDVCDCVVQLLTWPYVDHEVVFV